MEPVAGEKVPCSACIAGLTEEFNTTKVRDGEDASLQLLSTQMQAARAQLLSESVTSDDSTLQLLSPTKQPVWVDHSHETIH